MSKKNFIWVLLLTLVTPHGLAQQMLSIEDCRNLAIENNKALKIATEQERIAYYEKRDAFTKYFPQLSFSASYLRNQKNIRLLDPSSIPTSINVPPLGPLPGQNVPLGALRDKLLDATEVNIKNMGSLGFNLTQPIFMGGKIIALNDLRSYAKDLAKTQKDTQLTDIIVDSDNAYWQVVSIANKKRLAKAYVELISKMESDIVAMEEEGLATKADRLSVSVKLNEAEMTLTKAENGLSLSKMLLAQICGLEISDQYTLIDETSESLPSTAEMADASFDIDEAFANRHELKSLDLVAKMYQKKEKIAFAEFLPHVGLAANYEWTNPNSHNGFHHKLGGAWNVGVSVSVPLNFISNTSKYKIAKTETRIRQFELADAKEKITLQVNQEAYKMTEASKKLTTAKRNTDKADENLRYANAGFEEGVISASDALAAHTAWLSAHAEMIDAQIDLKLCRLYLNKALGRTINNKEK